MLALPGLQPERCGHQKKFLLDLSKQPAGLSYPNFWRKKEKTKQNATFSYWSMMFKAYLQFYTFSNVWSWSPAGGCGRGLWCQAAARGKEFSAGFAGGQTTVGAERFDKKVDSKKGHLKGGAH